MENPERPRVLAELLAGLARIMPPAQFDVLCRLFGFRPAGEQTYAEAAHDLRVSVATIKLRRRQAVQALRGHPELVELVQATVAHDRKWGQIHTWNEGE